ncbi:hypothetical protein FS837_011541 [Tulasnella sp. UAMH 9824]|nr:hypothetical protein FS837_011541 [Tulasnella sp. UAMH 9824]
MDQNLIDLIKKNFRTINIWLCISRTLLFVQYARVWYYRKRSGQFWSKRFSFVPLATLISAILFFVCYVIVAAVFLQAIAGALTPTVREGALKSEYPMSSRLASFTVIIMGEGLNDIVGTLRHNRNSLGLSHIMLLESVSILFMLYFIWLLYLDGFRYKYSPVGTIRELWTYLHFFFHLSLILLLEGVKNIFIYLNVLDLIRILRNAFNDALDALHKTGHFPEHPELETQLRVIGISWKEGADSLGNAIIRDDAEWSDESWNNVASTLWRWWGGVIHNVILLYNEDEDKNAESKFDDFMKSNNTAIAQDYLDLEEKHPLYSAFADPYFDRMAYTGKWIIVVGGLLLVFMAYINILQFGVGAAGGKWVDNDTWVFWNLPFITLVYLFLALLDWFMLRRSVHYIRNLGTLSSHLLPLPYGPGRPQETGSSPNGTDAQSTKRSSELLYAAGGEMEKSHGEKSISSSV